MVRLGIDVLMESVSPWRQGERLGLLCNHASVNRELIHTRTLLQRRFGADLRCIFSPQHGFNAEKQDNMIESGHGVDDVTGLPLFSLYGKSRRPSREMFACLDILLIDLQDVGTRVYTFLYTMAYCLEAARTFGKKVIVLDRPNPIDGVTLEGNLLKSEHVSFVGLYPLPMRHGLTFAELARFVNAEYAIGADLEVIPMSGWKRRMYYRDTGLPWVFPSPNMPTPETAMVYPGQVLWEGTTVSEGRGTTLPFELTGAPYWEHDRLLSQLDARKLPGCRFRPVIFEPTSGKWAGEACRGFHLHVTDKYSFRPYRTSLELLQIVMHCYAGDFSYKKPPYEYNFEQLPMDLILGDRGVRENLENNVSVTEMERAWQEPLHEFDQRRQNYLLYENRSLGEL
ncbi:MAG: DUF1343 domain-containing protein [Desulfofustis sp.]|nr:DUF1343 domain-containing protein [Desulfofustis sp.]